EELKRDGEGMQRENEALQKLLQEGRDSWTTEQRRLTSQIERLEQQLHEMSEKEELATNEAQTAWEGEQRRLTAKVEKLEQRLQEALQQKTQVAEELKGVGGSLDPQTMEAEITRVEGLLNEIVTVIENPDTELSTVIRKNVEKAELDAYLKGILFSLGKK